MSSRGSASAPGEAPTSERPHEQDEAAATSVRPASVRGKTSQKRKTSRALLVFLGLIALTSVIVVASQSGRQFHEEAPPAPEPAQLVEAPLVEAPPVDTSPPTILSAVLPTPSDPEAAVTPDVTTTTTTPAANVAPRRVPRAAPKQAPSAVASAVASAAPTQAPRAVVSAAPPAPIAAPKPKRKRPASGAQPRAGASDPYN